MTSSVPKIHWISAAVAVAAAGCLLSAAPADALMRQFLSASASVAGTLLGFLAVALSILVAVYNRRLITNMRKTGHYDVLVGGVMHNSIAFLAALASALISLIVPEGWLLAAASLTVLLLMYAVAVFVCVIWKFALVIDALGQ